MKKNNIFNIIAIISFIILCVCFTTKSFQNDTFYTIKIGKLILDNGIDMLDHFSWITLPYTYPHWLYDVIIYLIYLIGGYTGIYISTMIFYSILISLIYFTCCKLTKNQLVSIFMTIMCVIGLKCYATARAQLVSYSLFVLEFYFLETFLKSGNKKYLLGLFLISFLICNIHCAVWVFYFIMYLPFIAEYIALLIKKSNCKIKNNKIINFLLKTFDKKISVDNSKNYKYLIYIMLLSIFAGLLTPIGDTPYTYLIKTMMGNSQNYIQEHGAVTFLKNPLVLTSIGEMLVILLLTNTKIKFRDFCMLIGLIIMSLVSYRHVALLVSIGFICIARILSTFVDDFDKEITPKIIKFLTKSIPIAIYLIIVIVLGYLCLKNNLKEEYVKEDTYPTKAVEYIKENLDYKNLKLYNDYNFGSYLILNNIPVYIDSRADLYTKPFNGLERDIFDDYMDVFNNFNYYMDYYDIDYIIGYKNKTLGSTIMYGVGFKVLYEDKYFVIAERIKNNG